MTLYERISKRKNGVTIYAIMEKELRKHKGLHNKVKCIKKESGVSLFCIEQAIKKEYERLTLLKFAYESIAEVGAVPLNSLRAFLRFSNHSNSVYLTIKYIVHSTWREFFNTWIPLSTPKYADKMISMFRRRCIFKLKQEFKNAMSNYIAYNFAACMMKEEKIYPTFTMYSMYKKEIQEIMKHEWITKYNKTV